MGSLEADVQSVLQVWGTVTLEPTSLLDLTDLHGGVLVHRLAPLCRYGQGMPKILRLP